jgi:hypothetical protein
MRGEVPLQGQLQLGDLGAQATLGQAGQLLRVALAADQGPQHGPPRLAQDVRGHRPQLGIRIFQDLRRRASEDVARETFCSACSPGVRGRQYRVRGDVRARLVGELRASIDHTASDPTPASDTMDYQSPTPFSSYRVPHKRHK